MKFFKNFVLSHAIYILITALWPLIDIESFMIVTGPKTDIWLVKTVGALLIPVSLAMFAHLLSNCAITPLAVLGGFTAIGFIAIDLYYSLNGTISDIYLADAFIEFIFLIGWIFYTTKYFNQTATYTS
jgi:hypothetical protein